MPHFSQDLFWEITIPHESCSPGDAMTRFPAAYDFDEHVPVWKTWWFRLVLLLVFAGLPVLVWIG